MMAVSNVAACADMFELGACCDTSQRARDEMQKKFGFKRSCADARDVVKSALAADPGPGSRGRRVPTAARVDRAGWRLSCYPGF